MFSKLFKQKSKTRKVLIVDDEKDIAVIIGKVLSHNGYEVTIAESGQECLDKAESEQPDMILLDNKMPNMDGVTTLTRLKKSDNTKWIPVIMVTAYADEETMARARKAGVAAFIAKPFDYIVLVQKIAQVLESKGKLTAAT